MATQMIGPTEQRPTKPKLSVSESAPFLTDAIPIPRARMNGTVMGPVVTPPESKDTARNSGFVKNAATKTPI